jgi:hypothetical protein
MKLWQQYVHRNRHRLKMQSLTIIFDENRINHLDDQTDFMLIQNLICANRKIESYNSNLPLLLIPFVTLSRQN